MPAERPAAPDVFGLQPQAPTCTAHDTAPEPIVPGERQGFTETIGWLCPDCLLEVPVRLAAARVALTGRPPAEVAATMSRARLQHERELAIERAEAIAETFQDDGHGRFVVSTDEYEAYNTAVREATWIAEVIRELGDDETLDESVETSPPAAQTPVASPA